MRAATVACLGTATVGAIVAALIARRRRGRWSDDDIDAVLSFWFCGDIDELYEKRWFVQASSAAQRALDAEVRERFGGILILGERGELDGWRHTSRGALAFIVLLDQLSRHVHRGDSAATLANDARALNVTRELLERGWDATLDGPELIFALMPLRHQPTEARLREVLELTDPRLTACEATLRLFQRFRKHTELRLLHLEGRGDPDDILECSDRETLLDQSGAADEPLSRAVHTFLMEQIPGLQDGEFVDGRRDGRRVRGRSGQQRRSISGILASALPLSPSAQVNGDSADGGAHTGRHGGSALPALIVSLSGETGHLRSRA